LLPCDSSGCLGAGVGLATAALEPACERAGHAQAAVSCTGPASRWVLRW
jgi:hypothetical protein